VIQLSVWFAIEGKSGSAGLATGDHLHISDGVQVNPIEWWDEHWIKDHIRIVSMFRSRECSRKPDPADPVEAFCLLPASRLNDGPLIAEPSECRLRTLN